MNEADVGRIVFDGMTFILGGHCQRKSDSGHLKRCYAYVFSGEKQFLGLFL